MKKTTEFKGGASTTPPPSNFLKPKAGTMGSSFRRDDSISLEIKTFPELVTQTQMKVNQGIQKILKVRTGLWCTLLNTVKY